MCELNVSKYVRKRMKNKKKKKKEKIERERKVRLEQHTCIVGSDDDDGVRI